MEKLVCLGALLTLSAIPRASHLWQIGVVWSHLILETRHGSQDLSYGKTWVEHTQTETHLGFPFLRSMV